jgi:hypothetical protein
MDPYLEGVLWPDVHQALATKIRQALAPLVAPRYVVRLEIATMEDRSPEEEIGIMYPDVELLLKDKQAKPDGHSGYHPAEQATPATLTVPVLVGMRAKLVNVHILTADSSQRITSIEILSPINKRRPGLTRYRAKRARLIERGVHLLELDLLRRGSRAIRDRRIPACHYLLAATRGGSGLTQLWPLSIRDRLPVLSIPLREPDPDVPLDLPAVLAGTYGQVRYDLSIDYGRRRRHGRCRRRTRVGSNNFLPQGGHSAAEGL